MVDVHTTQRRRKYRPLDVRTWFEGFLQLIGWILIIVLAVVTGGIFMLYELKVLNRHDADFRDMYFDQRITSDVNNRYHKNFLLADSCCNPDPVIFPYSCDDSLPDTLYAGPPYCKPLIMIECADLRSAACNSTREVLYDAVGLSLSAGSHYTDCLRAGRVRVGAQAVAAGRPITLVAYYMSVPTGASLVVQSPFSINSSQVQDFVRVVAASVDESDVSYVQPSSRLSSSISLEGVAVGAELAVLQGGARGIRAPPPWKAVSNLWPWPGMNARCKNSSIAMSYYLPGSAYITIPAFSLARPDAAVINLTVADASMLLGAWRVRPVGQDGDVVNDSQEVEVGVLYEVQVAVGQVPLLGPCSGWQFSGDPNDLTVVYTPYWGGKLAELKGGVLFGPLKQWVQVSIRDVGGPRYIALPIYGGMWYIVNAFGMAFIWLVSNSLILFVIVLVWWNIRSNKGLPPIIYRYMKKYRGW